MFKRPPKRKNAGITIDLGALLGGSETFLSGPGSANGVVTYSIGARNIGTVFAGTIKDNTTTRTTAIAKVGTNTLTLTGANSYSGVTTINAGTLQIGDGGTAGTLGTGNVINHATLVFNRSDNIEILNGISGLGSLVQQGLGTLTITGTLIVVSTVPLPVIESFQMVGTNLIVSGSGGAPSGSYAVLSSTNVSLPLSQWTPIATSQFHADGSFAFTNAVDRLSPQRFYLLRFP